MNLFAALVVSAAAIAAAQSDIPHKGDRMQIVFRNDQAAAVVDLEHQVQLPDGRVSVIVLIAYSPKGRDKSLPAGSAGRIALDCGKRTWQVQSSYDLADNATIVGGVGEVDAIAKPIAPGSVAESVGNAVCGVVPSLPKTGKPDVPFHRGGSGMQITEL